MTEQLNAGIELMFIGMGIVFLFLVMLIAAVNFMSAIVLRYFPEPPAEKSAIPPNSCAASEQTIIAAISAAVHQHRAKHQSKV